MGKKTSLNCMFTLDTNILIYYAAGKKEVIDFVELAAELRRKYNLKLADAVVAVTAILTNSKLITRDIRDFKKVKELEIFKV
jgi:predicted nucleic acid-binding protein